MTDVTRILAQIESGDPAAAEQLLPLVYDELRKLAAAKLRHEQPGQTLQATALVHEAYLRLVGSAGQQQNWDSRGHFFAAAAEAMRRILVENARRKKAFKHGGDMRKAEMEIANLPTHMASEELLDLNNALDELGRMDPIKARFVTLRYFGGMTVEQAAELCGISRVTAFRYWRFCRAWLHRRLKSDESTRSVDRKKSQE
jgi:RNA polymerase sigma factor (TIGR02999 family)